MKLYHITAAALLAGGCACVVMEGCKAPDATNTPTTMMVSTGGSNMGSGMPPTMPVTAPTVTPLAMTPPKQMTGMTHYLTMDEPFFKEPPAAGAKPDMTLKAGSEVLVVVPGVPMSQVTTSDGATGFTNTEGLEPFSKK